MQNEVRNVRKIKRNNLNQQYVHSVFSLFILGFSPIESTVKAFEILRNPREFQIAPMKSTTGDIETTETDKNKASDLRIRATDIVENEQEHKAPNETLISPPETTPSCVNSPVFGDYRIKKYNDNYPQKYSTRTTKGGVLLFLISCGIPRRKRRGREDGRRMFGTGKRRASKNERGFFSFI